MFADLEATKSSMFVLIRHVVQHSDVLVYCFCGPLFLSVETYSLVDFLHSNQMSVKPPFHCAPFFGVGVLQPESAEDLLSLVTLRVEESLYLCFLVLCLKSESVAVVIKFLDSRRPF